MNYPYWGATLIGLALLTTTTSAMAVSQSQFELLGVSRDLSQLGVAEVWAEEPSGLRHCEVRMYARSNWQPSQIQDLSGETAQPQAFEAQCQALKESLVKREDLTPIVWDTQALTPAPRGLKDLKGNLRPTAQVVQPYPRWQSASFTLPDKNQWEIVVKSPEDSTFQVVLRHKLEPTPNRSASGNYQDGHLLLSPVKVLANNHYGLLALVFRDTVANTQGEYYFYHPFFLHWPEYQALSLEHAKDTLLQASDYAMEPDELTRGPNTMALGYRAYLRIKSEKLGTDELEGFLERASAAGKLYFLALLQQSDPQAYVEARQNLLRQPIRKMEVLEATGKEWRTVAFETLVQAQQQHSRTP